MMHDMASRDGQKPRCKGRTFTCTNAASEQFSADKAPKKKIFFFFTTSERVQDIQGLLLEPYTEQHIEGYIYIFDRKGNF